MSVTSVVEVCIYISCQTKISNLCCALLIQPAKTTLNLHFQACVLLSTHMQFLAARSLCTNLVLDRYSIPLAISTHIVLKVSKEMPYNNMWVKTHSHVITPNRRKLRYIHTSGRTSMSVMYKRFAFK